MTGPRVCIGLITCGRDELTAQTVRSFTRHNDVADPRFRLVHAAEAGDSDEMIADVQAHGWDLISLPKIRLGQMAAYRRVLEVAEHEGCEFTVVNENDWIWDKPFPWDAMEKVTTPFETCRLFDVYKHRPPSPRAPAGTKSLATGKLLAWRPYLPGFEVAWAHYVPLSITRTDVLAPWVKRFQGMKKMSRERDLFSLRVTENVVWSIGEVTTAGMKE